MENFFSDDDLKDILKTLENSKPVEVEMTEEMKASQRRYEEYIKKHSEEQ